MKFLTWGIYLVIFCLPLYLIRLTIFSIPTTILEILIYTLFIFWLLNKLIQNIKYSSHWPYLSLDIQRGETWAIKSLFIPITLILVGVSLTTIFSLNLRVSAGIWKAWFIDPFLFFIVIISVFNNFKKKSATSSNSKQINPPRYKAFIGILYSLFLSGTLVSIISLIYLIQGKIDPTGRLQAFYSSPNYLAMYLAPALIIGLGLFYKKVNSLRFAQRSRKTTYFSSSQNSSFHSDKGQKSLPRRKLRNILMTCGKFQKTYFLIPLLLSSFCLLISLFFTRSFSAWIGIIVAIVFSLILYLYKLKKKKIVLIILASGIVLVLLLSYSALTQRESSFNARLVIWQEAWQVFRINSVSGIGQPHNIFLAFLLQTGIIGFVGFIWLLVWFFRPAGGQPKADELKILLTSIMIYFLIHGLTDTTYWKNDLSVIFWIVIGLMVVIKNKSVLDSR